MTNALLDRIPPNNLEAEQAALGSLLIDKRAYYALQDAEVGLVPCDFYREAHQLIYETVSRMYDREEQVDIITVQEELREKGKLEAVGGIEYVMTLIDLVPTASNAAYYGKIVKEKAIRRQWIDFGYRLIAEAHTDNDVSQLSVLANEAELAISQQVAAGEWTAYAEIIPRVMGRIEEAYNSGAPIQGIPSGIPSLDAYTLGWHKKELTIIAARPSRGKTALALQVAEHAASTGVPVAVFSLEMDEDALGMRALQAATRMSGYALRNPKFGEEGWKRITNAVGELTDLPVYIDDAPTVRYTEIFPKARRAVMEHKVGLIVFDYTQLAEGPQTESRTREVGSIVRAMRTTAKRLDVPFIGLSQLSRKCEQENRRPKLSDLRDSGEIEQEIQVCIFVHFPDPVGEPQRAELIVAKNRQLSTGIAHVTWMPEHMRFEARSTREEG